ncbi:MAG TPA: hypothetical protein VGD78_04230 [Chthoniobacterales bacterium]
MSGKNTPAKPTPAPRPRPNQSPLWDHLELIRTMRMGRHTWAEIAEGIKDAGGPKVGLTTVYNFYKRAVDRARKGKPRPFGFEDPFANLASPGPKAKPVRPAAEAPASPPPSQTPDEVVAEFDRQAKALRNKPTALKIMRHDDL